MSDDEIADAIGMSPAEVTRRREAALERVRTPDADADPDPDPEPEPAAERESKAAPKPAKSRLPLILALGAVALIVLVVILASGGGGDDESTTEATKPAQQQQEQKKTDTQQANPAPAPAASSKPVEMQRLNGTHGHGTAQVVGAKLRLRLADFLVPTGGGYAVWLLGPGEKRLYATTGTTINRDVPLPANWKSYKTLEVARAVPSLDSAHTGFSLLRLPVSELSPGT
jgi:hypothetical protein